MALSATKAKMRDPVATRRRVLAAATSAFARRGFEGARVDAIAASAKSNKQLIYHHSATSKACSGRFWKKPMATFDKRKGRAQPLLSSGRCANKISHVHVEVIT